MLFPHMTLIGLLLRSRRVIAIEPCEAQILDLTAFAVYRQGPMLGPITTIKQQPSIRELYCSRLTIIDYYCIYYLFANAYYNTLLCFM